MLIEQELTGVILKCAYAVHSGLGPGLFESAYEECLYYKLLTAGLKTEKQKTLPLIFEEVKLEAGYRTDLLVEQKVIIEIKSVDCLADIHRSQVLTYLKLSGCKVGLLINLNVVSLRDGIKRFVL